MMRLTEMKTLLAICTIALTTACGAIDEPELLDSSEPVGIGADEPAANSGESLAPPATLDAPAEAVEISAPSSADQPSDQTVTFQPLSGHSDELAEARFVQLINEERSSRGMNELKVYWDLVDDARAHSKLMDDTSDLHHNPNLSDVTRADYWSRLGENVGRGAGTDSLHRAFMNSPGHRDNVLGDFSHVGVGVVKTDGQMWVTVVFMDAAVPGLETTYGPFTDDDFTTHEANIHKIWKAGLTYGCGSQNYCPDRSLTRGEMAAFLTRALSLPPTQRDHFDDDDGAWYETSANAMFESRVTVGCGDRRYCGTRDVTRGEMAVFLTRAFELRASGTDHFSDDDGEFYESSANAIREAGFTNGCGGGRFCGERQLSRAEMASFLARALQL